MLLAGVIESKEILFVIINQFAVDTAELAQRLVYGYYVHMATISVAADPRAGQISPPVLPGHSVPTGTVKRKDGTEHVYDFTFHLSRARTDSDLAPEFEQVWLAGSLIKLGDKLAQNQYFDRAPELELVRHLRNGIAHGNRFQLDNPNKLTMFPAHNRDALVKGDSKAIFEISPSVHGQTLLFNFMGAADVLDLILSVGLYLFRVGNGEPLRP